MHATGTATPDRARENTLTDPARSSGGGPSIEALETSFSQGVSGTLSDFFSDTFSVINSISYTQLSGVP